ncbi:MAG TPA: hypothetical protein VIZ86_13805 [Pseudomonas sp.]
MPSNIFATTCCPRRVIKDALSEGGFSAPMPAQLVMLQQVGEGQD